LTAISAAKAEPDTIASAVANKAIFFMTRVPINVLRDQLDPNDPQGRAATATKFVSPPQFGTRCGRGEAKKTGICRLFELWGVSVKGCCGVLLSNNRFGGPYACQCALEQALLPTKTPPHGRLRIIHSRFGAPAFRISGVKKKGRGTDAAALDRDPVLVDGAAARSPVQ
jgi:hypothetical protein